MKSQQCGCLNKTGKIAITVDMPFGAKSQCDQFKMVSHLDENLLVVNSGCVFIYINVTIIKEEIINLGVGHRKNWKS